MRRLLPCLAALGHALAPTDAVLGTFSEVARRAFITAPQRAVLDALPGVRLAAPDATETPADNAAGLVRHGLQGVRAFTHENDARLASLATRRHHKAAHTCRSKMLLRLATDRRRLPRNRRCRAAHAPCLLATQSR